MSPLDWSSSVFQRHHRVWSAGKRLPSDLHAYMACTNYLTGSTLISATHSEEDNKQKILHAEWLWIPQPLATWIPQLIMYSIANLIQGFDVSSLAPLIWKCRIPCARQKFTCSYITKAAGLQREPSLLTNAWLSSGGMYTKTHSARIRVGTSGLRPVCCNSLTISSDSRKSPGNKTYSSVTILFASASHSDVNTVSRLAHKIGCSDLILGWWTTCQSRQGMQVADIRKIFKETLPLGLFHRGPIISASSGAAATILIFFLTT